MEDKTVKKDPVRMESVQEEPTMEESTTEPTRQESGPTELAQDNVTREQQQPVHSESTREKSTTKPATLEELAAAAQQTAVPSKTFEVSTSEDNKPAYLKGWRLYISTLGYAMVFLFSSDSLDSSDVNMIF